MAPGGQHLGQRPGGFHHLQIHLPVSTSVLRGAWWVEMEEAADGEGRMEGEGGLGGLLCVLLAAPTLPLVEGVS